MSEVSDLSKALLFADGPPPMQMGGVGGKGNTLLSVLMRWKINQTDHMDHSLG